MLKLVRKVNGFTLIELMVVVAILGIMISVASTSYTRSVSKSRQAEAKLALSGVYALEKSFYSEYASYAPDMAAIGYQPEGNRRFYAIGWTDPWTGSVSGFPGVAIAVPYYDTLNTPGGNWNFSCPQLLWLSDIPAPTANDPQTFLAIASGAIRNAYVCDKWSITETKLLVNGTQGF